MTSGDSENVNGEEDARDRAEAMEGVLQRSRMLKGAGEIDRALDAIAAGIAAAVGERCPILCCVMNGGVMLTSELMKRLAFPLELDYVHATRYRNTTVGDDVIEWRVDPQLDPAGRPVVIVDDIYDEGRTLLAIADHYRRRGAAEVLLAVLVDKRHDRKVAGLCADFVGFELEDSYLFGFGMDYRGFWRNLPAVHAADESDG